MGVFYQPRRVPGNEKSPNKQGNHFCAESSLYSGYNLISTRMIMHKF